MSTVGRTWELWAQRHANGKLWHVGSRRWVELHGSNFPLVPDLVEEILAGSMSRAAVIGTVTRP